MIEVTAAQTLATFSKVNSSILKRLDNIDKKLDKTAELQKEPEQVLEKPKPVEIEGLSPEAARQLAKVLNQQKDLSALKDRDSKKPTDKLGKGMFSGLLKDILQDGLALLLKGALLAALVAAAVEIAKKAFTTDNFAARKAMATATAGVVSKVANVAEKAITGVVKATEGFVAKVESQIAARTASAAEKAAAEAAAEAAAKASRSSLVPGSEKALTQFYLKQGKGAATGQAAMYSQFGAGRAEGPWKPSAGSAPMKKPIPFDPGKYAPSPVKYETGGGGELFGWAKKGATWVGEKYTAGKQAVAGFAEKSLPALKMLQKMGQSTILKGLLKVIAFPGVIDSILGLYQINEAVGQFNKDKDKKKLIEAVTDATGGAIGSTLGMLGGGAALTAFGPAGTLIGGLVGSFGGDLVGRWLFSLLNDNSKESLADNVLKYTKLALPQTYGGDFDKQYKGKSAEIPKLSSVENQSQQTPITAESAKIEQPAVQTQMPKGDKKMDTYFSNNLQVGKEGNDLFKRYAEYSSDNLTKQLKLLLENNKYLADISEKLAAPANFVSSPTFINNGYGGANSLRSLQGVGN